MPPWYYLVVLYISLVVLSIFFFFKQKTAYEMRISDWSSDVCSSDLDARTDAGWQLELVQRGDDPDDWKPMKTVGQGVREIRIREASGAFRVIYLATLEDRVLVLHAFQKKTQATAKKDLELAAQRLKR